MKLIVRLKYFNYRYNRYDVIFVGRIFKSYYLQLTCKKFFKFIKLYNNKKNELVFF